MRFSEIVTEARAWLQRDGRLSYRTLRMEFSLTDEQLDVLKEQLIDIEEVATAKDGKMLIWTGGEIAQETTSQMTDPSATARLPLGQSAQLERTESTGERRQLTVMFCDLVGSTALSTQLDPEELQTVVRTYQEVSAQVIERYEGYIAQYLGDGLLVYFGYPAAHEDDAARAIRAGLEIVTALQQARSQFLQPVQVRIGIHTGPVVVGQMGGGSRHEQLALGETPNIAARVQGKAEPGTIVISAVTQRLIVGLFETEDLGRHELKGISTRQSLYRVVGESEAQSRFEVAVRTGLTPFIGREDELSLLRRRWERVQAGEGQVVLLSGEPGIGKSRLLQELKDMTAATAPVTVECRCSAYLQNSALSPVIGHLERLLRFDRADSTETKLQKLEQTLTTNDFVLADTMPLLAALLSLPLPDTYAPLQSSPQKQKEQTLDFLIAWLRKDAERQPVRVEFEDLHWADPSTVEFLTLLVDQVATMQALLVLTFRPEFMPPWPPRVHLLPLHLDRLPQSQIIAMAEHVAGKVLPAEIVEQMVTKADGVPLFVEELTKTVVESGQLQETEGRFELISSLQKIDIPTTLQDSLRARLDRLNTAQDVAQVGATIGREFSYELVQAVSAFEEEALREGLRQLVEADLVFQKGLPPQAQYVFKHALIQDTAYESLLKSRRQQLHAQTAQVLEQQFPEMTKAQPEVVAHHFTEAGLVVQAIPYWQQAGQKALESSAYIEATNHLTTGLALLKTLPDTAERAQQELVLQPILGRALVATKGYAAPEVGAVYRRTRELCQQVGETPQLLPVLVGLYGFHEVQAQHKTALEFAEQHLALAQTSQDSTDLLVSHYIVGWPLFSIGEFALAREHQEQGIVLYNPQQHRGFGLFDYGVSFRSTIAWTLWYLGYPDQARKRNDEALTRAQELAHPFSLAVAWIYSATFHQRQREGIAVQESAEAVIALCREEGFAFYLGWGTVMRGWALAVQGQGEEGIAQIHQGLTAYRATGAEEFQPYFLALLAEAYRNVGQVDEALRLLTEALSVVNTTEERDYEAELYRLMGELTLQTDSQSSASEAEKCFYTALEIARKQEAKSWELRAATSLARLRQQQGKKREARDLLAPVYEWFTEGFDTKDLQEAKILLAELL